MSSRSKNAVVVFFCLTFSFMKAENDFVENFEKDISKVSPTTFRKPYLEGKSVNFVGYLNVDLKSRLREDFIDRKQLKESELNIEALLNICLLSIKSNGQWNYDQCLTGNVKNIKNNFDADNQELWLKHEVTRFQLTPQMVSTHIVLFPTNTELTSLDEYHPEPLPIVTPRTETVYKVYFNGRYSFGEQIDQRIATLSLTCLDGQYGPFCSVSCQTPPTVRHRCDPTTGEVKCSRRWSGTNCDIDVFLSNEEASQFIHRSKRANSFFRFEEVQQGNIERECHEEVCSREEAREAFEDDALTNEFWRVYTDPNQCVPNPCISQNTVRCEDQIGDYNCQCRPGYHGKNCQLELDPCQTQPCENGGQCGKLTPTSYSCACPAGFRGHTCGEDIDECVESNCSPQGTCVDGINSFSCSCLTGFTGSTCAVEINECESDPCLNGGVCIDRVGFYLCNCTENFSGQICENRISPCLSFPCLNGGTCSVNADYSYNCACTSEYVGSQCQHSADTFCWSSPCLNDGICFEIANATNENHTSSQNFICMCPPEFRGITCDERIPPCELNSTLCPYNATCVSLGQDHICVCPRGFMGDYCQYRGEYNFSKYACEENPCLNEARCIEYDNVTTCICRIGFNGTNCEEEFDFCSPSPCTNDGECIPVPTGFYCNCSSNFHGKTCELDANECVEGEPLCNNGTCVNTYGSYLCDCNPFRTGKSCDIAFNPCTDQEPCQNAGTCRILESGGYVCDCLHGYGGTDCSIVIDPCTNITNPCLNVANCTQDPIDSTLAVCICSRDFYGRTCAYAVDNCSVPSNITEIVNGEEVTQLVAREDCGQNGECKSTAEGFSCDCLPGFAGDRCQNFYTIPVVNCTSETCVCDESLLQDIYYHYGNQTQVNCHYENYDFGTCASVTCLTPACRNIRNGLQCKWDSHCLTSYIESGYSNDLNSFYCPVIEISVNVSSTNQKATVEDFCQQLRLLSSFANESPNLLMHCGLISTNNSVSNVAVAIDSLTSERQAVVVAAGVFEQLEEILPFTAADDSSPHGIDPNVYDIIALKYSSFTGKPESTSDTMISFNLFIVIISVVAVILIIIIIVIVIVCRRRRQKKNFQVTYVVNPSAFRHDRQESETEAIVSPEPPNNSSSELTAEIKRKQIEEFINPEFSLENTYSNDLLARPNVQSNEYVSMPENDGFFDSRWSSSNESSPVKTAAKKVNVLPSTKRKNTIPGYEDMNHLTLPYDAKFPPQQDFNDAGANSSSQSPSFKLRSQKITKASSSKSSSPSLDEHTYEAIESNSKSNNSYEIIDLVLGSPKESDDNYAVVMSETNESTSNKENEYKFATDIPDIGVPAPFPAENSPLSEVKQEKDEVLKDEVKIKSKNSIKNGNDNESSDKFTKQVEEESIYKTPQIFFPQNDSLFFPKTTESNGELYCVPRKPNPVQ